MRNLIQQEEKAVFIFEKCSYEELQAIQRREDLLLSGWTLLEKEYIDVTEKYMMKMEQWWL